jgi:hypothetical protein
MNDKTALRLRDATLFGLVRGLGSAAGAALVTGLTWWLRNI